MTIVHPRFSSLESFALGDADAATRRRVAAHATSCPRCQATLRSLSDVRDALRSSPIPPMSGDVLSRTQARVARGDHVILPRTQPVYVARPSRAWIVAAAVIVAALLTTWRASGDRRLLEAGSVAGELAIKVPIGTDPRTLDVEYKPAATMAGGDHVTLRATVHAAGNVFAPPSTQEFTLRRLNDGRFSARVTLPSNAVLGRFSLASADGKHIDDNDARGWTSVIRDSAGRPSFDGLFTLYAISTMDDWEQSYAAAKDMARFHPEQPKGLRFVLGGAMDLAGPAGTDSVRRAFASEVQAIHRRYENAEVTSEIASELALLSAQVRDTTRLRFWRERLTREFPRSPGAAQQRVFMLSETKMSDRDRLAAYDRLWNEVGSGPQLLFSALNLATEVADSTAVVRWGDRALAAGQWDASIGGLYARIPSLRARGQALLRGALGASPAASATDWQGRLESLRDPSRAPREQHVLSSLGDALLADGKAAAALDTLKRAASLGWSAGVFTRLGAAALAATDTAAAVDAFAWAVADPRTSPASADSAKRRVGRHSTGDAWTRASDRATRVLREATRSKLTQRRFAPTAEMFDGRGVVHRLADVTGSGLAVVAFVSRNCAPSLGDLPSLQALASRFAPARIPVVAVVAERANREAIESLRRRGYSGPVYFDERAEVSRAMRQWGTPRYFVVESGASIRYSATKADDVVLAVNALRER